MPNYIKEKIDFRMGIDMLFKYLVGLNADGRHSCLRPFLLVPVRQPKRGVN